MYEPPTADGRCAIEPYLDPGAPGALVAYGTPREINKAVNRLSYDCVNDDIKGGGTIYGIGVSGFFHSFLSTMNP